MWSFLTENVLFLFLSVVFAESICMTLTANVTTYHYPSMYYNIHSPITRNYLFTLINCRSWKYNQYLLITALHTEMRASLTKHGSNCCSNCNRLVVAAQRISAERTRITVARDREIAVNGTTTRIPARRMAHRLADLVTLATTTWLQSKSLIG